MMTHEAALIFFADEFGCALIYNLIALVTRTLTYGMLDLGGNMYSVKAAILPLVSIFRKIVLVQVGMF